VAGVMAAQGADVRSSQRKTEPQRALWATKLLSRLTESEVDDLRTSMQHPTAFKRGRPVAKWPESKKRMREVLMGLPDDPDADNVVPEPAYATDEGQARRNIKDTAKRACEDLLWQHNTAPRQSIPRGAKAAHTGRNAKLDQLLNCIYQGVVDVHGREVAACEWPMPWLPCMGPTAPYRPQMLRLFFTYSEASRMSPTIAQLRAQIDVCDAHLTTLLKEQDPRFKPNITIKVVMPRDCPAVASCAQQNIGDAPVDLKPYFSAGYMKSWTWPRLHPDVEHIWPRWAREIAWHCDAGTLDLTRLALFKRGLGCVGGDNPPVVRTQ
jgi:hypothetical protein